MSFFLSILLRNLLIVKMVKTFTQNHGQAEAKKVMSQLDFVVDNWWIDPIENKEKLVYVIAVFAI